MFNLNRFIGTLFILFIILNWSFGQTTIRETRSYQWTSNSKSVSIGNNTYRFQSFDSGISSELLPTLPFDVFSLPLPQNSVLAFEVFYLATEPYPDFVPTPEEIEQIKESPNIKYQIELEKNQYYAKIFFTPIIRRGNSYFKITNLDLGINIASKPAIRLRSPNDITVSGLSSGDVFKIAVQQSGMHKITANFLRNELGIPIDNIDPRNIHILGDQGGMLPRFLDAAYIEDVPEIPIFVSGEQDGKFDNSDFILFFAQGPDQWLFDTLNGRFNMEKNIYDDKNYYFIKIDNQQGLRVQPKASANNATYTSNAFDDYARFEQDNRNLLFEWGKELSKSQGSGQNWFGDHFKNQRSYTYQDLFKFPGLLTDQPIHLSARMALRALTRSSFKVDLNGQTFQSADANRVDVLSGDRDNEINYANFAIINQEVNLTSENLSFKVEYPFPAANDGSEGWMDFIQVNVRRNLIFAGEQMQFRDKESLNASSTRFNLTTDNPGILIWDITNPLQPFNQEFASGNNVLSFAFENEGLAQFIAFNPGSNLLLPEAAGKITNQNLHGIQDADMLILYHKDFELEAQRLAEHRRQFSGLRVEIASIDQVYNEFSSGAKDPTAIRNFARLLLTRNSDFKYLLLFGDGSFDTRNIYKEGGDFIPTYQSDSFNPLFAFPADDFFAILEANTVNDPLVGRMSIAVGRLPVNNVEQASIAVDKIIAYDKNPETFTDWRNRLVFVADDEDSNEHINSIDEIATEVSTANPFLNLEKIYADAFPQVATPGGNTFPEVNEAISRAIFKGTLAVTYLGHGGPSGWAQERILKISDILSWENKDRLPIFLTATCTFGGYDDVTFTTAGEEVILNPNGGVVALLTTTRAVFSSSNARLTSISLEELFKRENGVIPGLGEAMKNAKNQLTSSFTNTNSRKFTLLGDPAQKLAIPYFEVKTDAINGKNLIDNQLDTLKALQKVTIDGSILDASGNLFESFNGVIFPTIFDKTAKVTTLGQDAGSLVRNFDVQKNVLFKGRSTVNNGRFKFTFVVPKDINFQFGEGKISYYAANAEQLNDAGGYQPVIIGGFSKDVLEDKKGPDVNLFMNSEDFVFGGITDENPVLLVKLKDENGINVVGNSIGHDLEAILDENTQNSFLLNDFYEADLDDYTSGTVNFPFSKLSEGLHNVKVKAWDVANNSAEGYTEFVVANSGEIALRHVLNYPNPFTDRTCFQFDHNLAGQELEVLIQIFTVSGRIVKTLESTILSEGTIRLDNCLEWDGRDEYGDKLARGIYLYKVKVRTSGANPLSQESAFEKLVILK